MACWRRRTERYALSLQGLAARPVPRQISSFMIGMIEEREDITVSEMVERRYGVFYAISRPAMSDWRPVKTE